MAVKNHLIKAFKVSEETAKLFFEVAEKVNLRNTDLSRLLFNKALHELKAIAQKEGWENIKFSVKELN